MTDLETLRAENEELREYKTAALCEFLQFKIENLRMREALEKISKNTVTRFDKSGITVSRNTMKDLALKCISITPHIARLARRLELMEKVIHRLRTFKVSPQGTFEALAELDAADKETLK